MKCAQEPLDFDDRQQWSKRWRECLPRGYPKTWLDNGKVFFAGVYVAEAVRDALRLAPEHKRIILRAARAAIAPYEKRKTPPDHIVQDVIHALRITLMGLGRFRDLSEEHASGNGKPRNAKTPDLLMNAGELPTQDDRTFTDFAPAMSLSSNDLVDLLPEEVLDAFSSQRGLLADIAKEVQRGSLQTGYQYLGQLRLVVWNMFSLRMRLRETITSKDVQKICTALRKRAEELVATSIRINRRANETESGHRFGQNARYNNRDGVE